MAKRRSFRSKYLRRMRWGIALLIVLAIPAMIHSKAAINSLLNLPSEWVPDSIPAKVDFNELSSRFDVGEILLFSWPGATLDSPELARVSAALQQISEEPETFDETLDVELTAETKKAIGELKAICGGEIPFHWARSGGDTLNQMTQAPLSLSVDASVARLKGFLVGPSGEQTCIISSLNPVGTVHRRQLMPALRDLIAGIADVDPATIAVVGGPREGADVDAASIRSVELFAPPSAILAAIICYICLRSVALTLAISVVAVIGEGLVLAIVYYSGMPMNAVLVALPPLVFVLTVSAGIHLSNYFLDAWQEFPDMSPARATRRALKAGIMPCFLASGTTVVGLGSLMLVRIEPIRLFGFAAAIGVIGTLALLLMVLPGAMILTKETKEKRDRRRAPPHPTEDEIPEDVPASAFSRWAYKTTRARLARPWPMIILFLVIGGVFSAGLFRLQTSVNLLRMFSPDSSIRTEYAWFEENVGPTSSADALLTFPPLTDDDNPLTRLAVVQNAHVSALKMDSVGGVLSAITFMRSVPTGRSIGASSRRAAMVKMLREPDGPLMKTNLIHRDSAAETWRISMRMWQKEDTNYSAELLEIEKAIEDSLDDAEVPVELTMTGHVAIVEEAQTILLDDLFRSFLTAFAVVAMVMMVLLRSVIGGLIAMIPNLFPTVALFGFMGLVGTPLDIGSVMTASVALGIAVDDTIHLLSRYGSRRARGIGQIRAAHGALAQCGWAMFQTTMVCGLSLMTYYFSDFVPTSQFSILMFGLLTAALFGDVFLAPSLMSSSLGRFLARTVGVDPEAELWSDEPSPEPIDARRIPARPTDSAQ
ncbi:efflux RND transporter permease subunit [Stieleria varia]|uniref:Bifunctional preprotein translocase subunit SecD/SecF n=1 Tax=Stieleria varia TaxID=2528005 RepID=A0A5C6BB08_9BACT|nr:MMPL family transporter [Stieleria varia]TWU08446.1 bifunctional preprotein translocase subunit SecD/SecF [Stieleria varia]